jgi:hypothetical protein
MPSSLDVLTFAHAAISLGAIGAGVVVLLGTIAGRRLDGWTGFFLAMTVATSVTGFFFPIKGITPGIVIGVISLVVLAVAIYARYGRRLAGGWRPAYVITASIALYLNVFVLIVQSFQKVPLFHALAPTQSEWPFAMAQMVTFIAFCWLGFLAVRGFRKEFIDAV